MKIMSQFAGTFPVIWVVVVELITKEQFSSVLSAYFQVQKADPSTVQAGVSDGYMLNMCSILLDFCMPFCQGDMARLSKVDPDYPASPACMLNYDFETCLAGGQIGKLLYSR